MKNLMLMLMLILFGYGAGANHFENGATVFVTAQSGLNMRAGPDMEGQVIYYLEYGDEVRITEYVSPMNLLRIDWIDGKWVKVSYEGVTGYVFDGYLSSFPVPIYGFEMCKMAMDIAYTIESYFSHHFSQASSNDTLADHEDEIKIVEKLDGNKRMVKTQKPGLYKLEVYIEHVRIMDMYNLIYGMFAGKHEREEYKNSSIFYEGVDGLLNKIKIGMESPVEIKKLKNGQIKITAYSYYDGC